MTTGEFLPHFPRAQPMLACKYIARKVSTEDRYFDRPKRVFSLVLIHGAGLSRSGGIRMSDPQGCCADVKVLHNNERRPSQSIILTTMITTMGLSTISGSMDLISPKEVNGWSGSRLPLTIIRRCFILDVGHSISFSCNAPPFSVPKSLDATRRA